MSNVDRTEFEVVVGPDGTIPASELARHGVRPGAHLKVARSPLEKRPPFRSAAGILAGVLPDLTMADFAEASERAIADAQGTTAYPHE